MQTMNPSLTISTKINLKQIIDIKLKPKIIKHLEENTGETLCYPGLSNDVLDSTQKKHKDFYSQKVPMKKVKKTKTQTEKKGAK